MTLPSPLSDVAAAVLDLLGTGRGLNEDDLVAALLARGLDLGDNPVWTLEEVLETEDLPVILPVGEGQYVSLPSLLDGRTLTHRVTAAEVEHGFLDVSPDLDPFSMLTEDDDYQHLTDGTPVQEVLTGYDEGALSERGIPLADVGEAAWLLEPDALRRLGVGAGGLVGVSVRPGGFELRRLDDTPADLALASRLAALLLEDGGGEPVQLDDLVWHLCLSDASALVEPVPPLGDLLEHARLVRDADLVAPPGFAFDEWRATKQLQRVVDEYELDAEQAQAVRLLSRLTRDLSTLLHAQDPDDLDLDVLKAQLGAVAGTVAGPVDAARQVLGQLADPLVAEAVLLEVLGAGREEAVPLALVAEVVEDLAPRAARPSLRWLQGKALERQGRVLEAERAYDAALSLDGSHLLALYEMARCASDRGDAERGLSLLRRAGVPEDDGQVGLLQHFRPPATSPVGRNEPCWCGSGRKYKVCHRGREVLPLEERAAWLYQKAATYVNDGPWRSAALDLASVRSRYWDQEDRLWQGLNDPLVSDVLLFEGGVFAAFVAERGVLLPDDERLLAEQWLLVERSVFEVEQVRPGTGFTARDLRTGDRVDVRERTGSRRLQRGQLVCARLVPAGGTTQCFGPLEPVSMRERDVLLPLLDSEPDAAELVEALSARFAPPVLQNTSGESLVLCEAVLDVSDPEALTAELDKAYERTGDKLSWVSLVVTDGMQRVRAGLRLDGERLVVETNSEPRMDGVLVELAELGSVRLTSQTRQPVEDVQELADRGPGTGLPLPAGPEVERLLEEVVRTHEASWLDESIPALGGATPREAAADPTRRPDLERLLGSFGPAGPGTMDAGRLRQALGL